MSKVKNSLLTVAIIVAPTLALSGGHSAFGGVGTGITVNTNVMQGTSGIHVQNTTNDVWIYDNPPEGFPPAINATCNWFLGFAAGQEQPVGGSVTCQAIDPNGDIALFNGTFQPDGTVMPVLIAGTGNWSASVGAKWIGATQNNPSETSSVYTFTPTN